MKKRDALCVLKGDTLGTIYRFTIYKNYSVRKVYLIVRKVHLMTQVYLPHSYLHT